MGLLGTFQRVHLTDSNVTGSKGKKKCIISLFLIARGLSVSWSVDPVDISRHSLFMLLCLSFVFGGVVSCRCREDFVNVGLVEYSSITIGRHVIGQ